MGIFRRLIPLEDTFAFKIQVTVGAGQNFTLPLLDYGGFTPNIKINWGDGNTSSASASNDPNASHTYSSGGTYIVEIRGFMPGFSVNNNTTTRALITGIVDFGNVGLRRLDFHGCSSITSIPPSSSMEIGYEGLNEMIDFGSFMRRTSLSSIPNGLFDFAENARTFADAFSITPITTLPTDLFRYCTLVEDFSGCFLGCTSLTSGGGYSTIFDYNTQVLSFSGTFRNCLALSFPLQFTNNTIVSVFLSVYNMSQAYPNNNLTGTAPEIWNRNPQPFGFDAFNNCTGLSNYASIPFNFK